jgi:hypothetical protein
MGGTIFDGTPADRLQDWISPNNISSVAVAVLSDDVEKHGDCVYTLVSDIYTPDDRAQIYTRLLGQEIKYQQIPHVQKYNMLMSFGMFNHQICMDLCGAGEEYCDDVRVAPEISILLGRSPESFEEYLNSNKAASV